MVVDVATTSSNEKTGVDDVFVSTQFYNEIQQPVQDALYVCKNQKNLISSL